ncbi:MAG: hypothetical protein AAF602_33510 [Myxococcota bacterium]
MPPERIILSGIWVSTMLIYLLGDVLRLFSGDVTPGEMAGEVAKPWMWTVAALIMLVPIVMVVLSLVVPYPAVRWLTVGVAVAAVLFNLAGLPYKGFYDNMLIVVSFAFNGAAVWVAMTWTPPLE